jgi:D-amino-acid dehydrogenase
MKSHAKQIQTEVLVIGGGVIGLACAYYLATTGRQVHLIEQKSIGAGASHGNCGLLFFSEILPLCQSGVVRAQLGRVLKPDSPLYIPFDLNLSKLWWLFKFSRNCNRSHMQHALTAREKLLYLSRQLYQSMLAREHMTCDWQRRGVLMVYASQEQMDQYEQTNDWLKSYGLAAKPLSRSALLRMEPALRPNVCGAWFHSDDSHLRPEKLLNSLKAMVIQKGVQIEENCKLERFSTGTGKILKATTAQGIFKAGTYVLAAGAWTPLLTRQVKFKTPVQPGKGYSITMRRPDICPRIPCYFHEPRTVATPWSDGLRLGGTMEFSGLNTRLNPERIAGLKQAAHAYLRLPSKLSIAEEWVGMRPMTYDDLPIIGRAPGWSNLVLATGHGMMGLTMATGTGKLVADLITGVEPALDPSPFSPARFG